MLCICYFSDKYIKPTVNHKIGTYTNSFLIMYFQFLANCNRLVPMYKWSSSFSVQCILNGYLIKNPWRHGPRTLLQWHNIYYSSFIHWRILHWMTPSRLLCLPLRKKFLLAYTSIWINYTLSEYVITHTKYSLLIN